jgi:transposase
MSMDPKALLRTEMIVKVRAGLMTATAAAEALGVSRKTYYKWEKKGLQAMLAAGQAENPGAASKEETAEVRALEAQGEDPDGEGGAPGGDGGPAAHAAAPGAPGR